MGVCSFKFEGNGVYPCSLILLMRILRITLLIVGFGALAYAALAADQIKTTESIIFSSDAVVTTDQSATVNFYIGDNLSPVTAPIKSVYFVVSGVYAGSGTFAFTLDSDGGTLQTFTLPNVGGTPTPFEFIYNDPSGKINPTSAGEYTFTLDMSPSGITVYGLAVKMVETHRYAPPICIDGAPTNQKIKTTESMIGGSDAMVNSQQDYPFTFYIGDNLSPVTNPLKSLHFTASGVYTGSGTVTFTIDSDTGTQKQFTLPNVGATPTPFEIEYQDPSGLIDPASAGEYTYTLNVIPSGISIYGLGLKMTETHRYAPPACGGMPIYGDLTSAIFDSTGDAQGAGYNSVTWKGSLGGPGTNEGKVRFQFAASDSSSGPWTYIGGATCQIGDWFEPSAPNTPIELRGDVDNDATCRDAWNNKRYFRYKIRVCSNDCTTAGVFTPTVDDVVVNWAP